MSRWICGASSVTRRGVKPLETSERSRCLPRRVHAEERHHLVRVRTPGALVDRDAHRVGVDALGADRVLDVGVPGEHPEVVLRVVVERLLVPQRR